MNFDQQPGVEVDCGPESISNGELVEGLHAQNIELSNDKALWKEKARMMEEALHEEAMERSKLQLNLDESHRRLRLLAREPLMSSSCTRALPPLAEIGLLKNAAPSKQREDIWDSEPELEDYLKRGNDDDHHHHPYTNEEKVLELEGGANMTKGYWESTERELEKKMNSLGRRPADFNNNNLVVQEAEKEFQNRDHYQTGSAAPLFSKNVTSWTARIKELERENSELQAQCLALRMSTKSALRVEGKLKRCCVELVTELDFARCKISSAEKRRDASEEIAHELREVAATTEKRVAELEDALTQRNAKVKEMGLSLDEVNNLFHKSMESLSYKLTCATTRADSAELKASRLKQENCLTENENLKLKSSLFMWQQKLEARVLEAEERAYEAERKASLSISDNEPLRLFEKRKESSDNMDGVVAGQHDTIEEHQRIAAENIAQAKAQAEENEALRSELDHILDMHSQQAGSMDQRLLHERRNRQRLEEELKSSLKAYNELEAQVLQRNTLLSSLNQQLDMLSNNTKKRPSSVMEEV